MTLGFKGELTRYGLNDVVFPGSSVVLNHFPSAEAALKQISVILWLKVNGAGTVTFEPVWPPDFREGTLTIGAGVEASYEPSLFNEKLKLKIYAGGEGSLGFGIPTPYFREAGFKIYTGLSASAWIFSFDREWVLLEYGYTPPGARSVSAIRDTGTGYVVEAAENRLAEWKPMSRPWREQGAEVFLAAEPPLVALNQATPELDVYASMEKNSTPGAVYRPVSRTVSRIINNPAVPAQAELPLLQNVFPNSEPALAARGSAWQRSNAALCPRYRSGESGAFHGDPLDTLQRHFVEYAGRTRHRCPRAVFTEGRIRWCRKWRSRLGADQRPGAHGDRY